MTQYIVTTKVWNGVEWVVIVDNNFYNYLPLSAGSSKPITSDLYIINNGGNPKIVIGDANSSGNYGQIQWNSINDRIDIGSSTDTNAISILENGYVGVGISNPSVALDVSGTIKTDVVDITSDWKITTDAEKLKVQQNQAEEFNNIIEIYKTASVDAPNPKVKINAKTLINELDFGGW